MGRQMFGPVLAALMIAVIVVSCSPRLSIHGNSLDPARLSEVKPGEMSRQEVQEILGSPSSKAVFDQESWYYISSRTEAFAFFKPKVTERNIVIVRFDKKGIVSEVKTLDLKDGLPVEFVERQTPTSGKELTFIEQMVGNIGRFTGAGAGK